MPPIIFTIKLCKIKTFHKPFKHENQLRIKKIQTAQQQYNVAKQHSFKYLTIYNYKAAFGNKSNDILL